MDFDRQPRLRQSPDAADILLDEQIKLANAGTGLRKFRDVCRARRAAQRKTRSDDFADKRPADE